MIKEQMKYNTFTEFVERAVELRGLYAIKSDTPSFLLEEYRNYVYSHNFGKMSETANNKCWEWLLSLTYEEVSLNDLYSIKGQLKKGR